MAWYTGDGQAPPFMRGLGGTMDFILPKRFHDRVYMMAWTVSR